MPEQVEATAASTERAGDARTTLSPMRWLVIPALLALFAIVGMAVASNEPVSSTEAADQNQPSQVQPAEEDGAFEAQPEPTPAGTPEVTVSSREGDATVRFDGDGVVRVRPDDEVGGGEIPLEPGTDDSYQISQGGLLTPVPADRTAEEQANSGVVLAPGGDFGVVVVTPEGDSVRLQADGVTGGVSAVDLNDESTPLQPNSDGLVVLDDGTTIGPLEEPGQFVTIATDDVPDVPWVLVFSIIGVVALVSAATGLFLHRKSEDAPIVMGRAPGAQLQTMAFSELLERLAADPDPTRAVRIGFDAAQAGLGGLPSRSVDETPFEWQDRVSQLRPDAAEPVQLLCDLFARARFAPGVCDETDRATMMEQLNIIHDLRGTTTSSSALESWTLESSRG